jgi:hypothetical protein
MNENIQKLIIAENVILSKLDFNLTVTATELRAFLKSFLRVTPTKIAKFYAETKQILKQTKDEFHKNATQLVVSMLAEDVCSNKKNMNTQKYILCLYCINIH